MQEKDFTFFWSGPFSNWYPSKFIAIDIEFNCGEQYMMFMKALLFSDSEAMIDIMSTTNPRRQKEIGRGVRNYSDKVWVPACQDIMVTGLYQKFIQNPELKEALLSTGSTEIAEASPYDKVWGIGMKQNHPDILDKSKWRGKNFLGIVLMKVRDRILADQLCEVI